MLAPLDEFPVHQIPKPIASPGSSDRNFYDRSYFKPTTAPATSSSSAASAITPTWG